MRVVKIHVGSIRGCHRKITPCPGNKSSVSPVLQDPFCWIATSDQDSNAVLLLSGPIHNVLVFMKRGVHHLSKSAQFFGP